MGPILVKLNPEGFHRGEETTVVFLVKNLAMVLGLYPPDIKRKNDNFFEK
jgi:hypothetical protein